MTRMPYTIILVSDGSKMGLSAMWSKASYHTCGGGYLLVPVRATFRIHPPIKMILPPTCAAWC